MRKKLIALVGVVAMSALVSVPANAAPDHSATYVAAGGVLTINGGAVGVPVGVGGYAFPASGDPASFRVIDTNGNGIGYTLCQETRPDEPTDTGCGDSLDPSQSFCSTGAFQALSTAFRPSLPTWLFVDSTGALTGCPQVATVGTATMRYA